MAEFNVKKTAEQIFFPNMDYAVTSTSRADVHEEPLETRMVLFGHELTFVDPEKYILQA